jgi:hypothetical protein
MLELLGKPAKIASENGDFGHESHPFRQFHFLAKFGKIPASSW